MKSNGAPFELISVDTHESFTKVLDMANPLPLEDESIDAKAWCNFYRMDDWAATAYFYLDAPENSLPPQSSLGL